MLQYVFTMNELQNFHFTFEKERAEYWERFRMQRTERRARLQVWAVVLCQYLDQTAVLSSCLWLLRPLPHPNMTLWVGALKAEGADAASCGPREQFPESHPWLPIFMSVRLFSCTFKAQRVSTPSTLLSLPPTPQYSSQFSLYCSLHLIFLTVHLSFSLVALEAWNTSCLFKEKHSPCPLKFLYYQESFLNPFHRSHYFRTCISIFLAFVRLYACG